MEYTALSNGVRLPMVGYGTFQLPPGSMCEQCVSNALEAGYRLFDTAASYGNEKSVDAGIHRPAGGGVRRPRGLHRGHPDGGQLPDGLRHGGGACAG